MIEAYTYTHAQTHTYIYIYISIVYLNYRYILYTSYAFLASTGQISVDVAARA